MHETRRGCGALLGVLALAGTVEANAAWLIHVVRDRDYGGHVVSPSGGLGEYQARGPGVGAFAQAPAKRTLTSIDFDSPMAIKQYEYWVTGDDEDGCEISGSHVDFDGSVEARAFVFQSARLHSVAGVAAAMGMDESATGGDARDRRGCLLQDGRMFEYAFSLGDSGSGSGNELPVEQWAGQEGHWTLFSEQSPETWLEFSIAASDRAAAPAEAGSLVTVSQLHQATCQTGRGDRAGRDSLAAVQPVRPSPSADRWPQYRGGCRAELCLSIDGDEGRNVYVVVLGAGS